MIRWLPSSHSTIAAAAAEVTRSSAGSGARPAHVPAGARQIVTATGYGGVGKTRLALRAADRSAFRYPDGVILLLASVRDPRAAAARPRGGSRRGCPRGPVARGPERPRRRRLLLDLEYLRAHDRAVRATTPASLRHAAGVTICVTSRQPLRRTGRVRHWRRRFVPGIATGEDSGSAVELLAQRAASVVTGFAVTSGTARPRSRCAVGWTASRWPSNCPRSACVPSPGELTANVPARMLTSRRAGVAAPPDDPAVDRVERVPAHWWSAPRGRASSVFAGTFDLAAAEAVCGSDFTTGQVTEAVIGLVDDQSCSARHQPRRVRRPPPPGTGCRTRPARLPPNCSPGRTTRGRPRRYVARWTTAAEHFARDIVVDQLSQYRALRREHDNAAAACGLALANDEAGHAARRRRHCPCTGSWPALPRGQALAGPGSGQVLAAVGGARRVLAIARFLAGRRATSPRRSLSGPPASR